MVAVATKHDPGAAEQGKPLPLAGLFYLFLVWTVWGSTYLAIRFAVRPGSGFPPFTMSGMRVAGAGIILLAWAALTRRSIRLGSADLKTLAISALLLWVGGNGLVVWAEQGASSGYAALLVGSMPIWVAILEAFLDRRMPTPLLILSLLIGFVGIGVLTAPVLAHGSRADIQSVVALLVAPISWGVGSVLQRRRPVQVDSLVSSGYQLLFGAVGFAVLALLTQEPRPHPIPEAWYAWAYLLVFGSLIGFTSFIRALHMLPTRLVMTYAYVNPVIAVFLGWLVLREPITGWTAAGSLLVLAGVAGVFRSKR